MPLLVGLGVTCLSADGAFAGTLRATDVISYSRVNWLALARAQATIRLGGTVEFIWPAHPASGYDEIRRAFWLAALHGIKTQTCSDAHTLQVLSGEVETMRRRLQTPFSAEIAIRDVPHAEEMLSQLIRHQSNCLLLSTNEPASSATVLCCQPDGVLNERSGVVFGSIPIAATFISACSADEGLVFLDGGQVATNVFVRRFKDGSATVVNLTSSPLRNLLYRRGFKSQSFDLPPAGVAHVFWATPFRFSKGIEEPFTVNSWKIFFEGDIPSRLVNSSRLPFSVPAAYQGVVTYKTTLVIPPGETPLLLSLDSDHSETEVLIGGLSLGVRAWEPFEWEIPLDSRGRRLLLEVRVTKRTRDGFLQAAPTWRRP